jgi:hypothetical protein
LAQQLFPKVNTTLPRVSRRFAASGKYLQFHENSWKLCPVNIPADTFGWIIASVVAVVFVAVVVTIAFRMRK